MSAIVPAAAPAAVPVQVAAPHQDDSKSLFNRKDDWNRFFRYSGYVPLFSCLTGITREIIAIVGLAINGIAVPIFAVMGDKKLGDEAKGNVKNCALWILRGSIETKPFLGNALVWSWDALNKRFRGKGYQSGLLYKCGFFPGVSIFTGGLRTVRGCTGAFIGAIAEIFYRTLKLLNLHLDIADQRILASHKFTRESLLEIPQGIIEMIPVCDRICHPLAEVAERIEQKKKALWREGEAAHALPVPPQAPVPQAQPPVPANQPIAVPVQQPEPHIPARKNQRSNHKQTPVDQSQTSSTHRVHSRKGRQKASTTQEAEVFPL